MKLKYSACVAMANSIQSFINKEIEAKTFESQFIFNRSEKIKNGEDWKSIEISDAMDSIFSAVDRFYDGEKLDEVDINAAQLYEETFFWWNKILPALIKGKFIQR